MKLASNADMGESAIFDEKYRVLAVDAQNLTIQGVRSGEVLRIVNADPLHPLTEKDYPPGKLIALANPSSNDVKN
jgi:hypothetical protein